MEYLERYNNWLESDVIDNEVKSELRSLEDSEIEDRFYKELEFGTAGLRGVIGNGSNRMNKYTVGRATQGIANYIISKGLQNKGVVISYDSRIKSDEFAKQTAQILLTNGIKVFFFEKLRPVPELSFSVRDLGATAGIMITASHNPPKYNGYKVYWQDGAQISEPIDSEIMEFVSKVKFEDIKFGDKSAFKTTNFVMLNEEQDEKYLKVLKDLVINPDEIQKAKSKLKIVYTPFHGTGNTLVEKLLKDLGFENVIIVPEQKEPDGNFPTVEYPNPEDDNAFAIALRYARDNNSDIILANDPDADRLGVWAKDENGEYRPFTGNQSALIIMHYRLDQMKKKGILPNNPMVIDSIVTSNMAKPIAKDYGCDIFETLTGFKNICKVINQKPNLKYVFGFEESYGCLIDDYARDKDGISAVMSLCEVASYCLNKDMTLFNYLDKMFEKYGTFMEKTVSIVREGSAGAKQIAQMIDIIRSRQIDEIGGKKVVGYMDVLKDIKIKDGIQTTTGLPQSNVIYFDLEDDGFACIRPSGTEPKIRIYIGVKASSKQEAKQLLDKVSTAMLQLVENS